MARVKKDPDRVHLSRCVGKLVCYERLGKIEEARQWAGELVKHLEKMKLIPPKPNGDPAASESSG